MSLSWPATTADLAKAGWLFAGWGRCRACGRRIAWYRTAAKRATPLEPKDGPRPAQAGLFHSVPWQYEPHFAHCPAAAEFRRKKAS